MPKSTVSIQPRNSTADVPPIFVSPDNAAKLLQLSRSAIFELLRRQELHSIRHGKRRLISRASIERWAERKLSEAGCIPDSDREA